MKINLILLMLFGIFLISFTNALTVESHGAINNTNNPAAGCTEYGANILVKESTSILKITKWISDGALECYLENYDGSIRLANGTFTDDNCTINYTMVAGTFYAVMVANNGTLVYANAANTQFPIPYAGNFINWTAGTSDCGAGRANSTELYAIKSIDVSGEVTSANIKLLSPLNNTLLSTIGTNFTANFNVSITNQTWKNATINIWRSNGTLFNKTTYTLSSNNTYLNEFIDDFTLGDYIWNIKGVYGNSTFNNFSWASSNRTFSVGSTIYNQSYSNYTWETKQETFFVVVNLLSGSEIALAKFIYNGTNYTVSDVVVNGNTASLTRTIDIPVNNIQFTTQNNSFYWIFTYNGGQVQTLTAQNQIVNYINFQECNATYSTQALNFIFKDEQADTNINAGTNPITFASSFNYWIGSGTTYKNYSFSVSSNTSTNSYQFCVYPINTTYIFKSNMDSTYTVTGYSPNSYSLRNATLTNISSNIPLYSILSTATTKFYVTIRNGVTLINDAIVTVSRKFLSSGNYVTDSVSVTDNNGKFALYAIIDQPYQFDMVKDGVLLGNALITTTCAAAPCSIDINLLSDLSDQFSNYDATYANNTVSYITYNTTSKIVTYGFLDLTGLAHYFRLKVTSVSMNESGITVCDVYSYSSSGTLTCNMTGLSDGDYFAYGYLSRSPEKIDKFLSFILSDNIQSLGLMGIFIAFAILLTLVIAGAVMSRGDPSTVLFVLGMGILLLKIMTIFPFSWVVVVLLEVLIFFVITKIKV